MNRTGRSARYRALVIRHILFDLDGTLTDSADGITRCLQHAVVSMNVEAPALRKLTHYIGTPLRDIFAALLDTDDAARLDAAIGHYRERFNEVGFSENRVYDGVSELLAELRARGYALYVATAKGQPDATRVIEHFSLQHFFDDVCGVVDDAERRDKARLIGRILAARDIPSAAAAMVGDRSHDMRGARVAGLRAIGAGWGYGSDEELHESGADWISARPAALLDHFPRI